MENIHYNIIMNDLADIIIRLNKIEYKIKKLIEKTNNMCFVYSTDEDSDDSECNNNDKCGCGKEPQKECEEIKEYLKNLP